MNCSKTLLDQLLGKIFPGLLDDEKAVASHDDACSEGVADVADNTDCFSCALRKFVRVVPVWSKALLEVEEHGVVQLRQTTLSGL